MLAQSEQQPAHQLEIGLLASQCAEQTRRFYQNQPHDDTFCYELIRRAVVKRDDLAWDYTLAQYRPQIETWVRRLVASNHMIEEADAEDMTAEAVSRCWRSYSADLFHKSTCLAEVLRYWQDCTCSTVFDWQRRQRRHRFTDAIDDERMALLPIASHEESHVESQVAAREQSLHIWRIVSNHCQDAADHLLARRVFVEGHKPRHVYAESGTLFRDTTEIYQRLRRLKEGLRGDADFHKLLQSE